MSLLKWITGGTFESNYVEANGLFEQQHFGDAKLAYQRALKKSKDATNDDVSTAKRRIEECSLELSLLRIGRAQEFFDAGDVERADEFLADALHISDSVEVKQRVQECREFFASQEEKSLNEEHVEMTEEELLAVISGAWTVAQTQEFSLYSERFYEGIIKAHDGEHKEAVAALEEVINNHDDSQTHFIYLELGRQQLLAGDDASAKRSLEKFVEKCTPPLEAKDELVMAFILLSNIHLKNKDPKLAEECLMRAYKTDTTNHIPLLNLGIFLRDQGELERSKRTLENAMDTMGTMHPDMRVFRELGHTTLAMGKKQEALELYKAVIDHCCQQGVHEQYDPEAALPLAKLYEEKKKIREASDIFRHLVNGYDTANHFEYNIESARLLGQLNTEADLVKEYLASAQELADSPAKEQRVAQLASELQL